MNKNKLCRFFRRFWDFFDFSAFFYKFLPKTAKIALNIILFTLFHRSLLYGLFLVNTVLHWQHIFGNLSRHEEQKGPCIHGFVKTRSLGDTDS